MALDRLLLILWIVLGSLFLLVLGVFAWLLSTTLWPKPEEPVEVFSLTERDMPRAPDRLKVMSWNVQYFAGKNYVFFYDLPDFSGPDTRPTMVDVDDTRRVIARFIEAEDPDILLLQEVDDGAGRTGRSDQLEDLLRDLPAALYPYYAETFYWKAGFVPHPKIMGPVGMKLVTLSKYPIRQATRYALPEMPGDPLRRQLNFKRAVLEVEIPLAAGGTVQVLNTHFDAFTSGTDTLARQVVTLQSLLAEKADFQPWLIGGDFNALAPGEHARLPASRKAYFEESSPLETLFESYGAIPSLEQLQGRNRPRWLTYFPNDPEFRGPAYTLDYLFFSERLELLDSEVMQGTVQRLSDHMPVIGVFEVQR